MAGVALPSGVTFVDNGNGTGTLAGTRRAGTGGLFTGRHFTATNGVGPPTQSVHADAERGAGRHQRRDHHVHRPRGRRTFALDDDGFPLATITSPARCRGGVTFVDQPQRHADASAGTPPPAPPGRITAFTLTHLTALASPRVTQTFMLTINLHRRSSPVRPPPPSPSATAQHLHYHDHRPPIPALAIGGPALPAGPDFRRQRQRHRHAERHAGGRARGGMYALTFTATNSVGVSAHAALHAHSQRSARPSPSAEPHDVHRRRGRHLHDHRHRPPDAAATRRSPAMRCRRA